MPAEVRLNFMFTFAQGNFFFFERIFEDSSGDCDFRKLSGNSHIISFTRQYFFRLSSFFSHKLFTNIQYDRNIKRTKNYFFDRFFSYFPLSKPTSGRFLFCIASQSRYCVDFMTWFFYFKVISEKIKAIYFFKATKNRDYFLEHIWK